MTALAWVLVILGILLMIGVVNDSWQQAFSKLIPAGGGTTNLAAPS